MNLTYTLTNWLITHDADNVGKSSGWASAIPDTAQPAVIPGVAQNTFFDAHGVFWYYCRVANPFGNDAFYRLLLRFSCVDYYSEVYADGTLLTVNEDPENTFYADVTDAFVGKDELLVAVRVINPPEDGRIDGFTLCEVPRRNKFGDTFRCGCCYNSGGIKQPVTLMKLPAVRVADVFCKADIHTGVVSFEAALHNDDTDAATASLSVLVRDINEKFPAAQCGFEGIEIPSGESVFKGQIALEQFKPWSFDEPNLYDVLFNLAPNGLPEIAEAVTVGFREFLVRDGWFFLNGKRVFLKSAHTGNHMPIGIDVSAVDGMELRDFQLSKAAGYNCIRFIATQASERQLDYCDRLGLMIYQEAYASWCLEDSDKTAERFNRSFLNMVRRDRNHACLVMYGALNETNGDRLVYQAAKNILPALRALDDSRLVLLSSGRWDRDFMTGSVSNPGSDKWEYAWGDDGTEYSGRETATYGDYHLYPSMPLSKADSDFIRSYGKNTRPVFFSECGVGSLLDTKTAINNFEMYGTPPKNPDYLAYREINEQYEADFIRFGCENTYALPEDFLAVSNKYNAVTRARIFDVVRSNPRFCGYNLTGLLDHAICGEGPYTYFRRVKEDNFDALADGWASVRWCLFTGKGNFYADEPVSLEAVLANEDTLPDGKYRALLYITDEYGTPYWRREVSFALPQYAEGESYPLLAVPVFSGFVSVGLPEGKYFFRVRLLNGGEAAGGKREFYVTNRQKRLDGVKFYPHFLDEQTLGYLSALGAEESDKASLYVVGNVSDNDEFNKLLALCEDGATVLFLKPDALDGKSLPLKNCFVKTSGNWVYHKEVLIKNHPVFDGMKKGLLDWDSWDGCFPAYNVVSDITPDDAMAVSFFVGGCSNFGDGTGFSGYKGMVNLAVYRLGRGRLVLNTFPLTEDTGNSPAADRLLRNLIVYLSD